MKMKQMLAAAAAALAVWTAQAEEIKLVKGEMQEINVSFGIKSYTPSNKDVVRIEKISETALRVTALNKEDRCDLEVRGDMGAVAKYEIIVEGDIERVLKVLKSELEASGIPEAEAKIFGSSVRVDGTVKSVRKWEDLLKVLSNYPIARNFVRFEPGEEILLKMKKSLEQSGFAVEFKPFAGDREAWKANTVALAYERVNRTMTVQARVWTPEQQAKIFECLKAESRWLDTSGKTDAAGEWQIKANVQVFVSKPVIRLSMAYMAIGEEDLERIGNMAAQGDGPFQINGIFDVLKNLVHGSGHSTRNASIGASLGVATRFVAQSGISRVSETGYTLVESWDEKGSKFKSGGTRFVKVYGRDVAELREIPYGYTIDVKGGLSDEKTMKAEIDFGMSTLIPMDDETYDRKEDSSKLKLSCPVGRTTFISGFKSLVDKNTPPSGIPYLRNIPLVNWFVADSGKEVSDRRLIVMICPEIVDSSVEGTFDTDKEINLRVRDEGAKSTEQRQKEKLAREREESSGWWPWNWF